MKITKIIALLLVVVMALCLAACGDKDDNTTPDSGDIAVTNAPSVEPDVSEDTSGAEANNFERGAVSGYTYRNSFAGITFTAPGGMYFYNDEEIAAAYNLSADAFNLTEATNVIYDMYCISEDGTVTFNINYENLQGLYGLLLDEKSYLDISKDSLEEAFGSSAEFTIETLEIGTTTIGGEEFNCIDVVLDIQGYPFYEKLVVKKIDGFMAVCTGGAFSTEELDTLFAGLTIK